MVLLLPLAIQHQSLLLWSIPVSAKGAMVVLTIKWMMMMMMMMMRRCDREQVHLVVVAVVVFGSKSRTKQDEIARAEERWL